MRDDFTGFFSDIQHSFASHGQGRPLAMGLLIPD